IGERKALAHLRAFPKLFPDSPILVAVYYLIGLNEEEFEKAKIAFEEAVKAFPLCLENGCAPSASFVYFRYQAMLQLAQLSLDHPSELYLTAALHLLHTLVDDFSSPDHPLTSLLTQKAPYPSLFEEGEYTLVKAYLQCGKTWHAQQRLSKILTHFDQAGIH